MTDTKKITQLTPGTTLTGNELFEMVQAGNSRSVRADQIPLATDSFITVSGVGLLPNSRYLAAGAGITLLDGGAGSSLSIVATGVPVTTPTFVVLSLDGVFPNERVLTGTANQVILTDGGPLGAITLSLPQSIATTSSPTFANLTLTNPLAPASGGTGIASYAVGDLLYASGATTLSKLADVAALSFLQSGGVGVAPAWSLTKWPNSAAQGSLIYASAPDTYSNLIDVAAGSYLRSGGVNTAPLWSTTTLPNSATTGDLLYASSANTYSNLADVAAGSYLRSGGIGAAPLWSATTLPNSATTGDLLFASAANTYSNLADVAAGSFLRSGGIGTAPVWSTTTLPNAATTGDILYASAANTWTTLADVASGSFLRSGGVTTAPVWSTTTWPNAATQGDLIFASATNAFIVLAKDANATRYLSNTGTTNNPAWAQVNLANGVTGDLPFANLTQIAGLSVLGVAGNVTADVAAITAASDGDILRRSGTTVGFGTIVLNAANFANPTASVGLAAVNGSATTAMRSDGAPVLSQSIVPTWTGKHTFTFADDTLMMSANAPLLKFNNTGAGSNAKLWRMTANSSGAFTFATRDDADSAGNTIVTVSRTGTTVDSFSHTTGQVYFPAASTTASAANAFLDNASSPANQILRSTSSRRYKRNIEDVEEERYSALMALRPVWYRSKCENDPPNYSYYGFIAEEVAEIDPRLVHWTRAATDDETLVPDGVMYDRVAVLTHGIVQRQAAQIRAMEARISTLESACHH
jgi:hypothetical protein